MTLSSTSNQTSQKAFQTSIWFQRDHAKKTNPSAPKKPFKNYNGPVYVPAEVYKLLSSEAVAALKKYNTEAINIFAKKRGIHVTDIAHQEPLLSEDTTPEEHHDPHQFDDSPDIESDLILDYINSQHHQEEDMNNAIQAYNVMTSPTSDVTPQRSINSVHIHLFYHIAQVNKPNMVHLLIGEPMVYLLGQMSESCPNPPGNVLLLVLTNTRSIVWTLCNVLHWSPPTIAMSTSS